MISDNTQVVYRKIRIMANLNWARGVSDVHNPYARTSGDEGVPILFYELRLDIGR